MSFRPFWLTAALVGLCAPFALAQPRVTVQLDSPQQRIEGWGTTVGGNHQRAEWRAAYRDLGMNILRVPMDNEVLAASRTNWATPVELTDDMAANLALMEVNAPQNLNPERLEIGFDRVDPKGATAQWLANNALEPERVKISGSPWTPPHWMKGPTGFEQDFVGVTDEHPTPFFSDEVVPWRANNPRSTGSSVGGRLKTEDPWTVDQYGKFMASWVAGWNQRYPDAPLDIVSLQNESTFENPFDSMTFRIDENGNQDFTQYAKGLKAVKDAWEQFGIETRVMGPHVAGFPANPGNPFRLWQQDMMIQGVKNHPDPELIDFLDFYNANFYNDTNEGNVKNIAGFWRGWREVAPGEWTWHRPPGVKNDGKGIWFSETGDGAGTAWSSNIETAIKIHTALVHGQASAYVYWQFSDGGNQLSQHVLLTDDQLDDPLQSKKYAAFKQYSRYIRPGAVRLDAGFDTANGAPAVGGNSEFDPENSLNVAAFLHEEDARLTFVLLNATDSNEQVTLSIPEGLEVPVMELFRTSGSESFTELGEFEFVDGELLYTAPAQSVSTFTGTVIPEPTGLALMLLGGLGLLRRRR
jgi:O-glycosyl hydrolase